jgi:transposase
MSTDAKPPNRSFSTDFKRDAMLRLEAGESLAGLARALGLRRKILYDWRKAWRSDGAAGLNRKRGRKPGWRKAEAVAAPAAEGPEPAASALARAERRIGELERLIGRQQVGLDFFRRALQAGTGGTEPPPDAPAPMGSSRT